MRASSFRSRSTTSRLPLGLNVNTDDVDARHFTQSVKDPYDLDALIQAQRDGATVSSSDLSLSVGGFDDVTLSGSDAGDGPGKAAEDAASGSIAVHQAASGRLDLKEGSAMLLIVDEDDDDDSIRDGVESSGGSGVLLIDMPVGVPLEHLSPEVTPDAVGTGEGGADLFGGVLQQLNVMPNGDGSHAALVDLIHSGSEGDLIMDDGPSVADIPGLTSTATATPSARARGRNDNGRKGRVGRTRRRDSSRGSRSRSRSRVRSGSHLVTPAGEAGGGEGGGDVGDGEELRSPTAALRELSLDGSSSGLPF